MSLIVPDSVEIIVLNFLLANPLTIKLYGNNKIPLHTDSSSDYTEVSGGGYTSFPLIFSGWTITAGDPSIAVQSSVVWTFTGVLDSPGVAYGYYVTRDSDNQLMWAERFPSVLLPFSPISGSKVQVTPRFLCQSLF